MFTQFIGGSVEKVYDGWPEDFILKLDRLRERDDGVLSSPFYAEHKEPVYAVMRSWVNHELGKIQHLDVSQGPGAIADLCLSGDSRFDELRDLTARCCSTMHISAGIYFVPALNFITRLAVGRDDLASQYFDALMTAPIWVYRVRQLPREAGRRGGNPGSRHKAEALAIARKYLEQYPDTVKSRLVQVISGELIVKYSDVPHLSSIRRWLQDIY